jgi:hypothetical protein
LFPNFRIPKPGEPGLLFLRIDNASRETVTMKPSKNESFVIKLDRSAFASGPYTYRGVVQSKKAGTFQVNGLVVGFFLAHSGQLAVFALSCENRGGWRGLRVILRTKPESFLAQNVLSPFLRIPSSHAGPISRRMEIARCGPDVAGAAVYRFQLESGIVRHRADCEHIEIYGESISQRRCFYSGRGRQPAHGPG